MSGAVLVRVLAARLFSFRVGVRKYQSGTLADGFNRVSAGNSNDKARLALHVLNLANLREQACKTADKEAQRCRGILTRQAPPDRKIVRNKSRRSDRNGSACVRKKIALDHSRARCQMSSSVKCLTPIVRLRNEDDGRGT